MPLSGAAVVWRIGTGGAAAARRRCSGLCGRRRESCVRRGLMCGGAQSQVRAALSSLRRIELECRQAHRDHALFGGGLASAPGGLRVGPAVDRLLIAPCSVWQAVAARAQRTEAVLSRAAIADRCAVCAARSLNLGLLCEEVAASVEARLVRALRRRRRWARVPTTAAANAAERGGGAA